MKNWGIAILVLGLALGAYSLSMDVGIDVPARDYGYGIKSPAMQVANIDKISQRQNVMIFSGILSVVGAILVGFGSMQQRQPARPVSRPPQAQTTPEEDAEFMRDLVAAPNNFSICSKCRHMGSGKDAACARCGAEFSA
jgi:hypothetical protein